MTADSECEVQPHQSASRGRPEGAEDFEQRRERREHHDVWLSRAWAGRPNNVVKARSWAGDGDIHFGIRAAADTPFTVARDFQPEGRCAAQHAAHARASLKAEGVTQLSGVNYERIDDAGPSSRPVAVAAFTDFCRRNPDRIPSAGNFDEVVVFVVWDSQPGSRPAWWGVREWQSIPHNLFRHRPRTRRQRSPWSAKAGSKAWPWCSSSAFS